MLAAIGLKWQRGALRVCWNISIEDKDTHHENYHRETQTRHHKREGGVDIILDLSLLVLDFQPVSPIGQI